MGGGEPDFARTFKRITQMADVPLTSHLTKDVQSEVVRYPHPYSLVLVENASTAYSHYSQRTPSYGVYTILGRLSSMVCVTPKTRWIPR